MLERAVLLKNRKAGDPHPFVDPGDMEGALKSRPGERFEGGGEREAEGRVWQVTRRITK